MRLLWPCLFIFISWSAQGESDSKFCGRALHPQVLSWFTSKSGHDPDGHRFQFGQSISISSKKYKVIGRLGSGGEAEVYLVSDEERLWVAKIFRTNEKFDAGVLDFDRLKSFLPAVHKSDPTSKTLILEYLEGVPVDFISEHGTLLGLSPEEIRRIVDRWLEWASQLHRAASGLGVAPFDFYYDTNAIYSFKEDRFFLIDAR